MNPTSLVTIIHGVIALTIVAAVTVLLALHDLTESTALALYGVAITLVGGTLSTALAAQIPTPSDKPAE